MGARIDPRSYRRASILAALVCVSAAAISACSSESNPKPPDTEFTTSSSTTTSATGTGGAGGGGTSSSSATGTGGSGGAQSCDGPNGCYSCPPKTGAQFLNACTTTQCSPFDNVKRLPLYNNGNLPPIP
jgi:hypothetical protein